MTSKDEAITSAIREAIPSEYIIEASAKTFEETLAKYGYKVVRVTEPAFHSGPRSNRS